VEPDIRPHLLVILGTGGPGPDLLAPSLAALARVTWLYDARDLQEPERELAIMRSAGRAVEVHPGGHLAAAAEVHDVDRFDGLLTLAESTLRIGAVIGEKLVLKANTAATVEHLTNKHLQRLALAEAGLPGPRFQPVLSAEGLGRAVREVRFPAVLKPARGAGGALTTLVSSTEELEAAWAVASSVLGGLDGEQRTHRLLADTFSPHMLLEEMLVGRRWHEETRYGDYVSVESLTVDGMTEHLTVSDKLPLTSGVRENGQIHPSVLPEDLLAEVVAMAEAGLRVIGVTDGITHTEIKLTAAGPRIIEINGRPAGGLWTTVRQASGYDVIAEAAKVALRLETAAIPRFTGYAAMLTPCLDAGLAGKDVKVGVDRVFGQRPGVHSVQALHSGPVDLSLGSGHALVAYVSGPTPKSIHEHVSALRRAIRISVREGAPAVPE
jgi:biotin carboxylase